MLRASSLSPRSAFFTALSARFPSKSMKKRYSQFRSGNGSALDLGHVQIVVDKMGQNVIQGSALVGDLQTQTDLVGIFAEDLLVRHNDKRVELLSESLIPFSRISSP